MVLNKTLQNPFLQFHLEVHMCNSLIYSGKIGYVFLLFSNVVKRILNNSQSKRIYLFDLLIQLKFFKKSYIFFDYSFSLCHNEHEFNSFLCKI